VTASGLLVAEATGVSKTFGASRALRDVSIAVSTGDSRALVGRNGAGKSTLVAVLTGIIAPDSGSVRLGGNPAPGVTERSKWRELVACVYQKSTLLPELTVAENLFLNAQPTSRGWINWPRLRRRAQEVLDEWGFGVDIRVDAGTLSVEQRQIVEIARALLQGTRFIILDEPTAELEGREVTGLFERINRLRSQGVTFIYISHYLEEIYEVCNSVTVLRDGEVVANAALSDMPKERVIDAMVGRAGDVTARGTRRAPGGAVPSSGSGTALEVSDLVLGDALGGVSFKVARGECVGLTGLAGSGKEMVGDAIAGLAVPEGGRVAVNGQSLMFGNVGHSQKIGVGYVPRDRHARGMVPLLSVAENVTMTIVDRLGRLGFISSAEQQRQATSIVGELEIVASSIEQPISELSGGNQQKAVFGRALASDPLLLVLISPTQGVDIASKEALFAIVDKARAAGAAVLIVSDDLDELVGCGRLLVMFKGRIVAEFGPDRQDDALIAAIEGFESDGPERRPQ
jgi:simple sugar transport system ATP-binding protein